MPWRKRPPSPSPMLTPIDRREKSRERGALPFWEARSCLLVCVAFDEELPQPRAHCGG